MEQISEELKTLDEMLAGDEGTDEDSATPTDDPDVLGSDTKGTNPVFLIKVLNLLNSLLAGFYNERIILRNNQSSWLIPLGPDAVLTSEEPEDSDFWEGVTKPGSTTATDTTSEHQVQSVIVISLNVCLSLPQDGTNSVLFSQAGEDAYDNQLTDNEVTEDGNILNWNLFFHCNITSDAFKYFPFG